MRLECPSGLSAGDPTEADLMASRTTDACMRMAGTVSSEICHRVAMTTQAGCGNLLWPRLRVTDYVRVEPFFLFPVFNMTLTQTTGTPGIPACPRDCVGFS